MSRLVFVLVFLLFLHACNARHLRIRDKKIDRKSQITTKDAYSRKLRSSSVHSEPTLVQAQEEHGSTSTPGADEFANTVMGNDLAEVILKKDEKKGGEVVISYSEETVHREEWRQSRSTLESSPNEVKETANSEDNETVAEAVVMDYAKPHRKPPIHNRKL